LQGQLHPIVLGLVRVREYRFVQVLREEIVVAVKNALRQVRARWDRKGGGREFTALKGISNCTLKLSSAAQSSVKGKLMRLSCAVKPIVGVIVLCVPTDFGDPPPHHHYDFSRQINRR
jgi:hypothetical protein